MWRERGTDVDGLEGTVAYSTGHHSHYRFDDSIWEAEYQPGFVDLACEELGGNVRMLEPHYSNGQHPRGYVLEDMIYTIFAGLFSVPSDAASKMAKEDGAKTAQIGGSTTERRGPRAISKPETRCASQNTMKRY